MVSAVVLCCLAAVLLAGSPAEAALRRLDPPDAPAGASRRLGWAALALPVAAAALLAPSLALWAATVSVALGTVAWLVRGHRRRRAEAKAAAECARAARVLSGLLRAGHLPRAALAEAATDCPVLVPAAAAAALGADIGAELLRASTTPGSEGMRTLAAAWRLSERSGAPVSEVLGRVAEALRESRRLQTMIDAELAAARASGHIMAVLPFLAVGLGFAVGVDPLRFLTGEPLGRVLLLVGVSLTAAGVLWIDRLARPRRRAAA